MRQIFCFSVILAVICMACNRNPQPAAVNTAPSVEAQEVKLPADFLEFYKKFHADSVYQMAHINFPLQGDKLTRLDSTHFQRQTVWMQASEWHLQHADFDPKDYRVEVQMLGDMIVIEKIMARAVNYGIERRFAKQSDGTWALIFYSNLQER